jgi:predicted RNase H-like nuclease
VSGLPPERVQGARGRVSLGAYGTGSKSERDAVYIDIAGSRYVLRRKNGPVFADAVLHQLVGKVVECDGFTVGHTLLAERIEEVAP